MLAIKAVLLAGGLAALLYPPTRPFGIACIAVLNAFYPITPFLVLQLGAVIFYFLRFT